MRVSEPLNRDLLARFAREEGAHLGIGLALQGETERNAGRQELGRVWLLDRGREDTMSKSAGEETGEGAIDVLVVDDEPMVRDFIARVLRRNGFTCRAVSDAGEAIATATDEPPHLAISDICMPGKDGTWLLAELRRRWPDLPVIMLTADSEAEQAVSCLKAGAQDYLVKPIDVDALLAAVWQGAEKARLTVVAGGAPCAGNTV
jgi:CheY-like chemotaxis protein